MTNPAPGFRDHPEHKILVDTGPDPVTVTLEGEIVAATTMAVIVREDGYPTRAYIPWSDVTAELRPTETKTHCPFKGDAVYYDVTIGSGRVEDGAWSYQKPYDEMETLKGHICFNDDFNVKIG